MSIAEALEAAKAAADPLGSLRADAIARLDVGRARAELCDLVTALVDDLRSVGQEDDADLLLELLDLLVGWAGPDAVIPRRPSERTLADGSRVAAATLVPVVPLLWPPLSAGDVIELHEGARVVGTATVVAVRVAR